MKFSIQKLMMGLVIVIVLAFVLLRGDQLVELVETMKKGAIRSMPEPENITKLIEEK